MSFPLQGKSKLRPRPAGVLAAAAAGALALDLVAPLERRLAGRAPVFAASRIAARLAPRAPPLLLGGILRLGWSALWALVLVTGPPGLATPATLLLVERLHLPTAGVTPPWRAWPPRQRALLVTHVAIWATAVASWARWRRRGRGRSPSAAA